MSSQRYLWIKMSGKFPGEIPERMLKSQQQWLEEIPEGILREIFGGIPGAVSKTKFEETSRGIFGTIFQGISEAIRA